jgi:hypothetical protein
VYQLNCDHLNRQPIINKLTARLGYASNTIPGPSGTVKILGVDQKLIIIIIFADACMHIRFFTKCVCKACTPTCFWGKRVCKACIPTCFFGKRVCKASIPTCFLGKRVWKLFYSVFIPAKVYPLFFAKCVCIHTFLRSVYAKRVPLHAFG